MGYHLRPDGLRVAQATLENFIARATRLYEQEREAPDGVSRLGLYVKRWCRWVLAGVDVSSSSSVMGCLLHSAAGEAGCRATPEPASRYSSISRQCA